MNDLETQLETLNKMHTDFEELRASIQKAIRDNGYPWRLRVIELRGLPYSPVTSLRLDVPDNREHGYNKVGGYSVELYPEVIQALDYGIRNKADSKQLALTLIDIWKRIKHAKSNPSDVKIHHVESSRSKPNEELTKDRVYLSRTQRYARILKKRAASTRDMARALRKLSGL